MSGPAADSARPSEAGVEVLVVDDQPANLAAIELALSGLPVHACRADSGASALRQLMDHDFAVILLDVNMPVMSGMETARLIRARDRSKNTPIIFMSAVSSDHDKIRAAYQMGAVDYLVRTDENTDILRAKVEVFVELYLAREREAAEVRRREQEQRQIAELKDALQQYRRLSAEAPPVKAEAEEQHFADAAEADTVIDLCESYEDLLGRYMDWMDRKAQKPSARMRALIERFGHLRASPRDLIAVHTRALEAATHGVTAARGHAFVVDGRLLALEMMGYLADFYRGRAGPIES